MSIRSSGSSWWIKVSCWLVGFKETPSGFTVREGFKIPSHGKFSFHMKMMRHGDKDVSLMRNEDTWMDWTQQIAISNDAG